MVRSMIGIEIGISGSPLVSALVSGFGQRASGYGLRAWGLCWARVAHLHLWTDRTHWDTNRVCFCRKSPDCDLIKANYLCCCLCSGLLHLSHSLSPVPVYQISDPGAVIAIGFALSRLLLLLLLLHSWLLSQQQTCCCCCCCGRESFSLLCSCRFANRLSSHSPLHMLLLLLGVKCAINALPSP